MINVNDTFRKEPDAGKPHVRNFCEGRTTARGASTRPINMGGYLSIQLVIFYQESTVSLKIHCFKLGKRSYLLIKIITIHKRTECFYKSGAEQRFTDKCIGTGSAGFLLNI